MTLELPTDEHIAACHTCICRTVDKFYLDHWTREMCGLARYVDGQPRPISFYALPGEHLLNSGLLVIRPNMKIANALHDLILNDPIVPTLYTVEQDLLAYAFRHRWVPLPWYYNSLKRNFQDHQELWR